MGFKDPRLWHNGIRLVGGLATAGYGVYRGVRQQGGMPPRRPGPPRRRRPRKPAMLAIGQVGGFGGGQSDGAHVTLTKARGSYTAKNKENKFGLIMTKESDMFRGLTRFDTNTGYFNLGFMINRIGPGIVETPMTIVNLLPMYPNAGTAAEGWAHFQFTYSGGSATNEASVRRSLTGSNLDGTGAFPLYIPVDTNAETATLNPTDNFRKALFHSIKVKFNLYGARFRSTDFYIDLVSPRDEDADFASADTGTPELRALLDSLTRPLMYSNILETVNNNLPFKKLRFIKRWKYNVPASTATDLNTAVGNLKEVVLNLKLKKLVNYMRKENLTVPGVSVAAADDIIALTNTTCQVLPNESARMYLIIRAFAPQSWNATLPANNYEDVVPSYDMSIKRLYTRSLQSKEN